MRQETVKMMTDVTSFTARERAWTGPENFYRKFIYNGQVLSFRTRIRLKEWPRSANKTGSIAFYVRCNPSSSSATLVIWSG